MKDLLDISSGSGDLPFYYQKFPMFKNFSFPHKDQIINKESEYSNLKKDECNDRSGYDNFLGKNVNFFNDCIPRFEAVFEEKAIKAYDFVFRNGSFDEEDLPPINLDTGRLLDKDSNNEQDKTGNNLDKMPVYWEGG